MTFRVRQPRITSRSLLGGSLAILLLTSAVALAEGEKTTPEAKAEPKQVPAAVVQPAKPKVDHDRPLMGEFVGPVEMNETSYLRMGLQIRPLGEGQFDAIQYLGGLPGERGHRPAATALVGMQSGNFVILSGGPWAVFVEKDHCLVINRQGKQIGRLERIHRKSPTMGALPPKDAFVLFDGTGVENFTNGRMTKDGLLMEGADMKPMFQDFSLHVEFRLPYVPDGRDQGRANSGIYLQSRYESQILDSFAQPPVFNGCGALYRFKSPDVNMCLPPMVWQTYDIAFTAPRWASDGTKLRNARVTSWLNGVKIQNNVELPDKTGHGQIEEPLLLPTKFQDHKNPVRFRNIWVIDRGLTPAARFPVQGKPVAAKPKPAVVKKPTPPKQAAKPVAKPTAKPAAKPKPAEQSKPKQKEGEK